MSLLSFLKQFPDDDACWRHLEAVRWSGGPVCPKCGNVGATSRVGRAHYHGCRGCGSKFTVAFGTALEGTHLPMRTWFTALYLLAVSSKGLSSAALARHLGVGQKTAWFLLQRIRSMMAGNDPGGLLRGIVEADETYAGGKARKRGQASRRDSDDDQPPGRGGSRKAMVVAAVERGGRVVAKRGRTHGGKTISGFSWAMCRQTQSSQQTNCRHIDGSAVNSQPISTSIIREMSSCGMTRSPRLRHIPTRSRVGTRHSSARSPVSGIVSRPSMRTGIWPR